MRVYANTTRAEFIQLLFRSCQDANMPTQVIDCIEDLGCMLGMENALAKAREETEQAEEDAFDLYSELAALLKAIETIDPDEEPNCWREALDAAKYALARQAEYK